MIDRWMLISWSVTSLLVSVVMLGVIIGALMNLRDARRRRREWIDRFKAMVDISDDELRKTLRRRRGDHEDHAN